MKNQKKHLGRAGASLPLVLCVIAFLIAFSLALTYAASLLLSRTNVKIEEQRCYQLARSFAEQLDAQLTGAGEVSGTGEKGSDKSFLTFVNLFLTSDEYSEYVEEKGKEVYTYDTDNDTEDGYGSITVKLYKETTMSAAELSAANGELLTSAVTSENDPDYTDAVKNIKNKTFDRYTVTVEVIAEYDGLTYSYKTEYDRADTYGVDFVTDADQVVVWNETKKKWYVGTEYSTNIVDLTKVHSISYTYQTSSVPLTVTYKPVHAEYTAASD